MTPEENRARVLRWQRENRAKVRAKQRRYEARHRERRNDARRGRDPAARRARHAVEYALLRGDLVRADRCEECGVAPGVDHADRSLIQAHHDDYSQPLMVRWLCSECHGGEHARLAA
jgi:hypothetical protein